jgi:deazaflavin-dependent oxidoreductase (nitroreductase family)
MGEDAFPDGRWGTDVRALREAGAGLAATRAGSWCLRKLTPLDLRVLRRSNGRYTVLGPFGIPVLLLTTIGGKSGQRRSSPLIYQREGDRLFLFGSNWGQAKHPAWSWNLRENPDAWVTMAGQEIPVLATELTGDEYDRVYQKFLDFMKVYQAYRTRTDRRIRVFALTRR